MYVTPLPGVNRGQLQQTLRALQFAAGNARGERTAVDRVVAYLEWANTAARQLRGQVRSADLDRLVFTQRHWILQSLAPNIVLPAADLADLELEDREKDFAAAFDDLGGQIRRWSGAGVVVVPDTSFFIMYEEKFDNVDYATLLQVREAPVQVVMPIIVVDELDRLKQAGHQHVRFRAAYTLAVLDRLFASATETALLRAEDFSALRTGGIPRGAVSVELVLDPPGHTRLPINDDELIDRAVAVKALADRQVALLTCDTNQSMRARAAGLIAVKLVPLDLDGKGAKRRGTGASS